MERHVRYSPKREAILNAIRATQCHPSAEWIYHALKPAHPDLSMGTVYRNLALFRKLDLIKCVCVVNGQERFDALTSSHSHFVCSRCGAVIDLPGFKLEDGLERAVSEQYKFTVERHELIFYGVCCKCSQNEICQEEEIL